MLENAYAIFANVLEFNVSGSPVNAKYAELRAAQYIRWYCDASYMASSPSEIWEQELHDPPPRSDSKPCPPCAGAWQFMQTQAASRLGLFRR